jgi:hypothetical protein
MLRTVRGKVNFAQVLVLEESQAGKGGRHTNNYSLYDETFNLTAPSHHFISPQREEWGRQDRLWRFLSFILTKLSRL